MARYPNGKIPKSVLVHLGGDHWLTPATKVRWDRLVADVLKNEGVRLQITGGPNAYRDIGWQQHYWDTLPYPQASYPGGSSHGGDYKGRDSMAIDVGNWGLLGKEKFYAYARKHGFEPNFFDWEPWHIIDWSPWAMPAGGIEDNMPTVEEISHHLMNVYRFNDGSTVGRTLMKIKRSAANAEILAASDANFFKHGDMPEGSVLWIYVMPNGDFVRIRDHATAVLYKERAGQQAVVLTGEAIRLLVADLVEAGGRDLTATPDGEVETPEGDTGTPSE